MEEFSRRRHPKRSVFGLGEYRQRVEGGEGGWWVLRMALWVMLLGMAIGLVVIAWYVMER